MKWDAVGVSSDTFGGLGLTVLLGLGELCDYWDVGELLAGQCDGFRDGFFFSELNIADAAVLSVTSRSKESGW